MAKSKLSNMTATDILEELGCESEVKFEPTNWTRKQFKQAATSLGYDERKLMFPRTYPIDTKQVMSIGSVQANTMDAGMITDLNNGTIRVYPKCIPLGWERGILAHEIFHVKYKLAVSAWVDAVEGITKNPKLVRRFKNTLGTPLNLADMEHVSNYATFYVLKMVVTNDPEDLSAAVTEILSEMARIKEMTGKLVNTKNWKNLYKQIEKTAKELGM